MKLKQLLIIGVLLLSIGCTSNNSLDPLPLEIDNSIVRDIAIEFIERDGPNCVLLDHNYQYMCSVTSLPVRREELRYSVEVTSYWWNGIKLITCDWIMYLQYSGHGNVLDIYNWSSNWGRPSY